MKTKISYRYAILAIVAALMFAGLSSCENFLNVRPKSQIPAGLHFERESGYKDQLTGVYTKMCTEALYGRNMTFGLMEVLSQNYDLDAGNVYRYAVNYNYTEANTRKIIDSMWTDTYNCIANLNIMLEHIDKADKKIFSGNNYRLYKGEALGLRAFLHFDMLRIFAPSPASNASARGIPYLKEYAPKIVAHSTVAQALDLIIEDLEESAELLEVDSLKTAPLNEQYLFGKRRQFFNYFAAQATLARVYMYKGDHENALRCARIIYDQGELGGALMWTHFTSIETTYDYECNRAFTLDQVFQLKKDKMDDMIKLYFTKTKKIDWLLSPNAEKADLIFEKTSAGLGNDYRMDKGLVYEDRQYLRKFWQYEGGKFNNLFPLIRKTEAYYILAELLKTSDPQEAIAILNLVRSHRNLTTYPLPSTLTADEIQNEIFKEYRKEFLGEGQLFFYYKRLNISKIEGAGVTANDAVYVLPLPNNELEFGRTGK